MYKKNLSQNFLIDENIKKKMINLINIKKNDILLEIGAGEGAISKNIVFLPKKIFLIELDKCLIHKLKTNIKNSKKAEIYNENIFNFNFKDLIKKYKKIRIIGNIPYKISSKLLFNLISLKKNIKDIHFIIQKDLSDRLNSKKNNNNCTGVSKIIQHNFNIKCLFNIKANSFKPAPKIKSIFIKITSNKSKDYILDYNKFILIIKNAFNNKRKLIKKSIKNIDKFKRYVNIKKRANDISIIDYIRISNLLIVTKI